MSWSFRGVIDHPDAVAWMEDRRRRVLADPSDPGELLLCVHPPTITLGRHADPGNLLQSRASLEGRGVAVHTVSRGGDATYHGPGQLLIYPVVRVGGVARFVCRIARALADVVAKLGVPSARWRDDPAGLWVPAGSGERKLAACGLHVHRGVCIHGFALNVSTPAGDWRAIRPCGLESAPISLADLGAEVPDPDADFAAFAARVGPAVWEAALGRSHSGDLCSAGREHLR